MRVGSPALTGQSRRVIPHTSTFAGQSQRVSPRASAPSNCELGEPSSVLLSRSGAAPLFQPKGVTKGTTRNGVPQQDCQQGAMLKRAGRKGGAAGGRQGGAKDPWTRTPPRTPSGHAESSQSSSGSGPVGRQCRTLSLERGRQNSLSRTRKIERYHTEFTSLKGHLRMYLRCCLAKVRDF